MTGEDASTLYDTIGTTYAQTRQPDPRIRDAIRAGLGAAASVVNVGAGTGSYEPPQTVLAVEPSRVMIAQRPPGLAPAVITTAERIPLRDKSVDVALCILTIHHWPDLAAGIGELRRVARRGLFFTWDREVTADFWLFREYFPEMGAADYRKAVPLGRLVDLIGPARITPVRVPHDCVDGFLGAFWRRPAAYLDPVVRAGISGFTLAPPGELSRGLAGLEADLSSGVWRHRHQDLLRMGDADLGYRLVVADWAGAAEKPPSRESEMAVGCGAGFGRVTSHPR